MTRLKEKYTKEVVPALTKEFGYKNIMAVPKIAKIVVNMGLGVALGADQLHVRRVQRRLALDDPALDPLARVRLGVPLDQVDALDDEARRAALLRRQHLQDPAALAAVLPRDHQHVVVLPQRAN